MRHLDWLFDDAGDSIQANHPYFHDQGCPLSYIVTPHPSINGHWVARFEGHAVTEGPLAAVLMEVEKDARSPVGIPVALRTRGIK